MKKVVALALILIMALGIVGCSKKYEIPSLDEVKSHLYTEEDIEIYLRGVSRDDLIEVWGEPSETLDEENADMWVLDEERILTISYSTNDKLQDADITKR